MTLAGAITQLETAPTQTPLEAIRTQMEAEQSRARRIALLATSREQNATMSAKVKRHYLDARALQVMLEHINPNEITSVRTMILSDRFAHDSSLFLAAFNGDHLIAGVINTRYVAHVSREHARDWISAFDCTSNSLEYTGDPA
jgi:hypothetical protein